MSLAPSKKVIPGSGKTTKPGSADPFPEILIAFSYERSRPEQASDSAATTIFLTE